MSKKTSPIKFAVLNASFTDDNPEHRILAIRRNLRRINIIDVSDEYINELIVKYCGL